MTFIICGDSSTGQHLSPIFFFTDIEMKKEQKQIFSWTLHFENIYKFYIFWLHVSHTNCMTFIICGDSSTGQHLSPIFLFTDREMKKRAKINILMDFTF